MNHVFKFGKSMSWLFWSIPRVQNRYQSLDAVTLSLRCYGRSPIKATSFSLTFTFDPDLVLPSYIRKILYKSSMLRLSSFQKKPYTAVTVQIDRLTSEQYEGDDMTGIVDLIEVIRLQSGGPTEAARAIRKKL